GDERQADRACLRILDAHPVGRDGAERATELSACGDGLPGAHPDPLAEGTTEVRLAQQRPVEARRRTFEVVAPGHRVVGVEYVPQLARYMGQLVEGDAALGPVDEQAKHRPPPLRTILHV